MSDHGGARGRGAARPLVRQERRLRAWLIAGAIFFGLEAVMYVPLVFTGPATTRPFAINSVAKDVVFCTLTALAAGDIAQRVRLVSIVLLGHVVIATLLVLTLVTGNTEFSFPPPDWLGKMAPFLNGNAELRNAMWLVGALAATGFLAWLLHAAQRARYDLKYLWGFEHSTLAAMADAILTDPVVDPEEIATEVDHYWAGLDIGYKLRLRLALWLVCFMPLVFLRLPFALMSRGGRTEFVRRRLKEIEKRSDLGPLRTTVQSSMRFAMQLVYMAYYNDPRTYGLTGYQPFSERGPEPAATPIPELRVLPRPSNGTERMTADVVIIGSGAGGSLVAHVLAERGRNVLVLERGRLMRPSEFTENEADQYAKLYSDGALQLSRDFSFQVLQGMCVGGSTVVNNGVCFDIPAPVLDRWNADYDAGLDTALINASTAAVRALIGAASQATAPPNPLAPLLGKAAAMQPVSANLCNCVGCGYCNIGCKYNRKLSMLVDVLPRTQQDTDALRVADPSFRGRLEVLADCEVTEITRRDRRATGVKCELRLPDGGRRKFEVKADTIVLAAGAIHSSRVLISSRIGGGGVGRGLAANIGSHMTGFWPNGTPLRAYEGLQMSHYRDAGPPGYKIETWFNPVMSQAMVMPGWLKDHEKNMHRYNRLAALGVIAGSTSKDNFVLRRPNFINGAEIQFTPTDKELATLLEGLREAGKLMLADGADCVMPATFKYKEFTSDKELDAELQVGKLVHDASDISVNTAHPQGGNGISRNRERGVVDDTLRVHGFDNLHVCDASVFPSSVTVNPQLTVMTLAHYAATNHMS